MMSVIEAVFNSAPLPMVSAPELKA